MTENELKKLKLVSPRARALYARVKKGRWHDTLSAKTPKAMKELEGAGLVQISGRVAKIQLAYVPVEGFLPFRTESWT